MIDRKALWAVRESGLPSVVKSCVDCSGSRHRPSGKFRVNANGVAEGAMANDRYSRRRLDQYPAPVSTIRILQVKAHRTVCTTNQSPRKYPQNRPGI